MALLKPSLEGHFYASFHARFRSRNRAHSGHADGDPVDGPDRAARDKIRWQDDGSRAKGLGVEDGARAEGGAARHQFRDRRPTRRAPGCRQGLFRENHHRPAVHALQEKLEGLRVDIDERDETVGKRIRDAELEKIPYVVVYGDKESDEALAVRKRGGEQFTLSLDALRADISEVATL